MKSVGATILCGLGVEAVLVAIFLLFPVGPCDAHLPGVVVLCLHYPAAALLTLIFPDAPDKLLLVAAPIGMTAVWSSIFAIVGYIRRARAEEWDGLDSKNAAVDNSGRSKF